MQRVRDVPDHLETDEGGEHEDHEMVHEARRSSADQSSKAVPIKAGSPGSWSAPCRGRLAGLLFPSRRLRSFPLGFWGGDRSIFGGGG